MASIKLKFRPSSVKGKKGVLSYQIIHYRLTRLIKTSYRIMPSEWDDSTGSLLISTQSECKARLLLIRDQTNWEMTRLQGIINDLERTGVEYTIDDIVASFRKIPSVESVFNFMQRCINKLERQKRGRTAEGYTSTMNSFIQFRKNEDLSFEAFDSELMEMYEAYLKEKGLVKNSTSYYMRIWRSVYNLAVEQGYTTDKKPFKHVYTGIDKTVKRAVPFKIIKMIKELDLSFEPQLELARDIFLFSFYTRGMSFIDMAHLKKSNLQNGILTYSRKKTGQRLTILWEELMQEIVDKYKDDTSEYLLPILRYCDINDRKQYKLRAKQIGRGLNKIGLRLELKAPLTFYVARSTRDYTAEQLLRDHKTRGFRTVGYHFYIRRDGSVTQHRKLLEVGAHCRPWNRCSIGICYEGGLDADRRPADTRTPEQTEQFILLLMRMVKIFPGVRIRGHRDMPGSIPKACPCFDAEGVFGYLEK